MYLGPGIITHKPLTTKNKEKGKRKKKKAIA